MVAASDAGRMDDCFELYSKFLPLIVLEAQAGGLGLRKEIYRLRGLLQESAPRAPTPGVSVAERDLFSSCLEQVLGDDVDLASPVVVR